MNKTYNRFTSVTRNAFLEGLEDRRLMSGSIAIHSEIGHTPTDETHTEVPHDVVSVKDTLLGTCMVTGEKTSQSISLAILSDANGKMVGRLKVGTFNLGEVILAGTHTGNAVKLTTTTQGTQIYLAATVSADGKMTGTLTVIREGKTRTAAFNTESQAAKTKREAPKPVEKPVAKPVEKPVVKPSDKPVTPPVARRAELGHFGGDVALKGSTAKSHADVKLTAAAEGKVVALFTHAAFGSFMLTGTRNGNTITFTGTGEKGTTTMTLTLSADGKTLGGSASRVNNNVTTAATFTLKRM